MNIQNDNIGTTNLIVKNFKTAFHVVKISSEVNTFILREDYDKHIIFLFQFTSKSIFLRFSQLVDLTCIDMLTRVDFGTGGRFLLIYNFISIEKSFRVKFLLPVADLKMIKSVCYLFPPAGWLEREIWDMFGVFFYGNPDLRRLLTDYGFEGFPLRKDFPLSGFMELAYDDELKLIIYKPIELAQEFRLFEFQNPW